MNGPCAKCSRPALAPDNEQVVAAFLASLTQVRKSTVTLAGPAGTSVITHVDGLDYSGAEAAARGLGIDWPAVFPGVRMAESEWLDIVREQQRQ